MWLRVFWWKNTSVPKNQAVDFSDILVPVYQTTLRRIPDDCYSKYVLSLRI